MHLKVLSRRLLERFCRAVLRRIRAGRSASRAEWAGAGTSAGTFLTVWGSQGTGDGEFDEPYSVVVGADGLVFVTDTKNHRIQKFAPQVPVVPTSWGQIKARYGRS